MTNSGTRDVFLRHMKDHLLANPQTYGDQAIRTFESDLIGLWQINDPVAIPDLLATLRTGHVGRTNCCDHLAQLVPRGAAALSATKQQRRHSPEWRQRIAHAYRPR